MFTCHVNTDHASKCINKYKKVYKNLKIKAFLAKLNKAKKWIDTYGHDQWYNAEDTCLHFPNEEMFVLLVLFFLKYIQSANFDNISQIISFIFFYADFITYFPFDKREIMVVMHLKFLWTRLLYCKIFE